MKTYRIHRFYALIALFVLVISTVTFAAPDFVNLNEATRYRFHADHKQIQSLERTIPGIIVDEATTAEEAFVYATPTGLANLYAAGFAPVEAPLPNEPDWWTSYPTAQQVSDSLVTLAARHPLTARIDTIGYSVQNRPLVAITVGANVNQVNWLNKPGIMLIGTIHGIEKPGTPLLMNFAEWLLDSSAADARITRLMTECRIHILPLMNPDGYVANTRANHNGQDLNRNFPCKTSADSIDSPTGRQPETQAVMAWSHAVNPLMALNFHTGSVVANYPFDSDLDAQAAWSFPVQPDKQWFIAAADSYAVHNPTMWANNTAPFQHGMVNGVTWYQITGGLQDYHTRYLNCRHITIEFNTQQPPPASALPGLWNDNKNGILAFCSLVWQGVDVTLAGGTGSGSITPTTRADLGFGTPNYNRLGSSSTFRFLFPVGDYYPRIYQPYLYSTWNNYYLFPFNRSAPVRVSSACLISMQTDLWGGGREFVGNEYNYIYGTYYDSVLCSPFEEYPNHWDLIRGGGDLSALSPDSIIGINERNWLIRSLHPNGFYFPLYGKVLGYDGAPNIWTTVDTMVNFSDTVSRGTGVALRYTPNGRDGGGIANSPSGNYSNSVDADYTFGPYTVSYLSYGIFDSLQTRISFTYRGNMEKGYDYWIISVSIDSGAYIPMDTLTGIVNNWQMWFRDFPVDSGSSVRMTVHVHTDASITRSGFTMDDLTISSIALWWSYVRASENVYLPNKFSLFTYPNPFNSTTRIALSLPKDGVTKVALFDMLGREVSVLRNETMKAGKHTLMFNGEALASGVYFLRAVQGTQVRTQKIALIR